MFLYPLNYSRITLLCLRVLSVLSITVLITTFLFTISEVIYWLKISSTLQNLYELRHGSSEAIATDGLLNFDLAWRLSETPPSSLILNLIYGENIIKNWLGLPTVGALLIQVFGVKASQYIIIFLNITLVYLSVKNYMKLAEMLELQIPPHFFYLIGVGPFFLRHIWSLSKEPFSLYIFSLLSLLYLRHQAVKIMLLIPLVFFIRSHYIAIIILLLLSFKSKRSILYILLALSIIAPYIPWGSDTSFFENQELAGTDVSSAGIMVFLAKYFDFPGGYLIQLPIRVMLNIVAPLTSITSFFQSGRSDQLAYAQLGLTFITLSLLVFWNILKDKTIDLKLLHLVLISVMVFALIPYLQPRYYIPLMPILLILAFKKRIT